MIRIYQKGQNVVNKISLPLKAGELKDLVWIDLQIPSLEEIDEIEKLFHINIPTRLQQEEIESSSRYLEAEDYIVANSTFLTSTDNGHFNNVHVSFLIKSDLLVTYRDDDLPTFAECVKKIKTNSRQFTSGRMVLLILFETRIDFDADLVENLSRQITSISKQLTEDNGTQKHILKQITAHQETTMLLRENIIDKQRVISALFKSGEFSEDEKERLRIMLRDIGSLIDHASFLFERLEYLQNTFLGLVNIDQNQIIKIFTVVSVVFMPPTLIASIYGMNFKFLPELSWKSGYPFAVFLMIASSLLTLYLFKKKKWL